MAIGRIMAREPGLFDVDARLRELSAKGDDLERVNALVDFEAFRSETRAGGAACGPFEGRPPALRPRADVSDPDPSGQPLAVGRADRVSRQGPSLVHAVPWAVAGGPRAGCELDLELPRGADAVADRRRPGDRGAVPPFRGAALGGGLHRHGRADRRRDRGGGAEAAQHRGREARAEGRPHPRGLGLEAREAGPEGPRRALGR